MFRLYRVNGASMLPNLEHGDLLLAMRRPYARIGVGRLAVVCTANQMFIIKRICAVLADGNVVLSSDNPAAQSRFCGVPVRRDWVCALVLFRLPARAL